MLLAGTDINGDNDYLGQFRYVAIVIGTPTAVSTLFNKIGLKTIEMKHLKKDQRRHVLKTMNFKGKDFLALCLKIDRQRLIDFITTHPHSTAKFIPKNDVYRSFDLVLLSLIRNKIDGFCQHHDTRFEKLVMQCDPDMSLTANNWKLSTAYHGKAYEFADAVSFCYEHKWRSVKGCDYFDFVDKIKFQLLKEFKK